MGKTNGLFAPLPVTARSQPAVAATPQRCEQSDILGEAKRQRLSQGLTTAMAAHEQIRNQSKRLTQGKKLSHFKLCNAYDLTIAPIVKGKSNCPAQFGRKPGIVSEPASGYVFANLVPKGNPSDYGYVLPLFDKVQHAITYARSGPSEAVN